jgi:hypothetical protein
MQDVPAATHATPASLPELEPEPVLEELELLPVEPEPVDELVLFDEVVDPALVPELEPIDDAPEVELLADICVRELEEARDESGRERVLPSTPPPPSNTVNGADVLPLHAMSRPRAEGTQTR